MSVSDAGHRTVRIRLAFEPEEYDLSSLPQRLGSVVDFMVLAVLGNQEWRELIEEAEAVTALRFPGKRRGRKDLRLSVGSDCVVHSLTITSPMEIILLIGGSVVVANRIVKFVTDASAARVSVARDNLDLAQLKRDRAREVVARRVVEASGGPPPSKQLPPHVSQVMERASATVQRLADASAEIE